MPSFDVVSEVNHHELSNGVDQANREVTTRFDFKGTGSKFELAEQMISMHTESDFQLKQMYDILCNKLVKRGIDIACLEKGEPVIQARTATQSVKVNEGIDTPTAKDMVKRIKQSLNSGLKIAGILLTMFDTRTNLSHQVAENALKYFKNLVFKTTVPRNVRLGESPSFGKPIFLYDAASIGAKSYLALAEEITNGNRL